MRVLLVGIGGFTGSILRYWLSGFAQGIAPSNGFPWGTWVVNMTGCLAMGVLVELIDGQDILHPLLVVGLLGGFTTFSAFSNETVTALRNGMNAIAMMNIVASLFFGLTAVVAGRAIVNFFWK